MILEAKHPVIIDSLVGKNQGISKAAHRDAVFKGCVNMDNIQDERLFAVDGAAMRSLWDSCIGTQR